MRFLNRLMGRADQCPAWAKAGEGRAVDIGWILDAEKATFIWPEPQRSKRNDPPPVHAKSVQHCPAVLEHESRMFEIGSPIDVRIGFRRDDKGAPVMYNADGDASTIRSRHLNEMIALVPQKEWRHPERPMIQIATPYIFVADEPVYMTQMPPITHYQRDPWPGTLIGGRLPIHIWPRQMIWAFEWFDLSKLLVLKRGEPWFNVRFETFDPSRPVRLFEAELTPELSEHIKGLSAVSNYVDKTYSLYKVAEQRRPEKLLVRKVRESAGQAEG